MCPGRQAAGNRRMTEVDVPPSVGHGSPACLRLLDIDLVYGLHSVALVGQVEGPGVARNSELFFRFAADCVPLVGLSGDPFLAALLVPAMVAGLALEINAPVSERLLRRTVQIQDLLLSWYPRLRRIPVTAPTRSDRPPLMDVGRGVGAFFSGGIDSCFTLLKNHLGWPTPTAPLTHLVFVKGFDARLSDAKPLADSEAHLRAISADYERTLVVVETNLRDVLDAPWGEMHHGAALAAVAHCVGPGLHSVLIPASGAYDEIAIPWGSHPLLDERWSTEWMEVVHDGAEASRVDKLAALVRYAPALVDRLRVCYEGSRGGPRNCGHCAKCVRTMVMLRALGHLGRTPNFPGQLPEDYAQSFPPHDHVLLQHVLEYARAGSDRPLVRSLERRARTLVWRADLPRLLRAHPLGAAVLDLRAAVVRRWAGGRKRP
jgi:hypothetical protein